MSDLPLIVPPPWEEIPTGGMLPLSPEDVPERASTAVRRTLLRYSDPDPDLVAAVVIAALRGDPAGGAYEVRVVAPDREFPLMTLAADETGLGETVGFALRCCRDVPGFEIRVRELGGD